MSICGQEIIRQRELHSTSMHKNRHQEIGKDHEILIIGDMNAHLEESNRFTNATGRMLQESHEDLALELVNA